MLKYVVMLIAGCTWCTLLAQSGSNFGSSPEDVLLWYEQPATEWTEALPLGNGHMGAMVFGGIDLERLQLNEATLYSGDPARTYKSINIRQDYPQVIALLSDGRYAEAQKVIQNNWLGRNHQSYQPMGDVWLAFSHAGKVMNYRRSLDLSKAIASVSYEVDNTLYTREYFISHPDKVMVVRLKSKGPRRINCTLRLSTQHEPTARLIVDEKSLQLEARVPAFVLRRKVNQVENINDKHKYPEIYTKEGKLKPNASQVLYDLGEGNLGMQFRIAIRGQHKEGTMSFSSNQVVIKDAEEALLLIAAATSYNGYDKSPAHEGLPVDSITWSRLDAVEELSYATLYSNHLTYYQSLFGRMSLELGERTSQSQFPTDRRLALFGNGSDLSLIALYFQFGRYLLISGSQPGGQPLNLQGIWNDEIIPPWNGAYTLNINAQMNYWPAELTNLSECHEPFFQAIKELSVNGKSTAWNMYGNEGWVAHHNMDIWRHGEPIDYCPCSFWPMAAGWLTAHLWERYLFTGDKKFLKDEVYPLLRGVVQFYKDWLVTGDQGYLITPVGHSPENSFRYSDGLSSSLSPGPTMDIAIIRESYSRYIELCSLLDIHEDPVLDTISKQLPLLQPYQVGRHGQLQEWLYDFEDSKPKHRHTSHLYGMYPGNQISIKDTPALAEAVKKVLEQRGDGGMGWSKAWKINLWARLLAGDRALEQLQSMLVVSDGQKQGETYINLLCGVPFQIDGNLGTTAGIAEMLVQSHAGEIHLLPALPTAWSKGKVKGLRTRGGFEIDMEWENGNIKQLVLKSSIGGVCRIRSTLPLMSKDLSLRAPRGKNPNPLFQYMAPEIPYVIGKGAQTEANKAGSPASSKPRSSAIEFDTVAGGKYTFWPLSKRR